MICTTIPQSKYLIDELGVSIDTADMHYILNKKEVNLQAGNRNIHFPYIPAWSLSALFDILPQDDEPQLTKWKDGTYSVIGTTFSTVHRQSSIEAVISALTLITNDHFRNLSDAEIKQTLDEWEADMYLATIEAHDRFS